MKIHSVDYEKKMDPTKWKDLYGEKLGLYAERNFKGFTAIMYHLLIEKKEKFDLVVGAGNSGSGMVSYVELIYKEFRIPPPLPLRIPIQRYKKPEIIWSEKSEDLYDNKTLLEWIKVEVGDKDIKKVLYVDDETSPIGLSFKTTLQLLEDIFGKKLNFIAISEEIPNLEGYQNIEAYSWAKRIENLWSVIFYILSNKVENTIDESVGRKLEVKWLVCILLGAPLRQKIEGVPTFDYKLHEEVREKVADFEEIKLQFINRINELIREGVTEYQREKITLH